MNEQEKFYRTANQVVHYGGAYLLGRQLAQRWGKETATAIVMCGIGAFVFGMLGIMAMDDGDEYTIGDSGPSAGSWVLWVLAGVCVVVALMLMQARKTEEVEAYKADYKRWQAKHPTAPVDAPMTEEGFWAVYNAHRHQPTQQAPAQQYAKRERTVTVVNRPPQAATRPQETSNDVGAPNTAPRRTWVPGDRSDAPREIEQHELFIVRDWRAVDPDE